MEGTWDDYWVYPQFNSFLLNDTEVVMDGLQLDHMEIAKRL